MVKIWYWKLSYPNPDVLYHLINFLIKVKIKGFTIIQYDNYGIIKAKKIINKAPRERGLTPG